MTETDKPQVSREEIRLAYKLFLGRWPSESEVERTDQRGHSYDRLSRTFLNSPEFLKKTGWTPPGVEPGTTTPNTTTPEKAKTLIHLHVPKSAGSTLTAILAPSFPNKGHMTVGDNTIQQLSNLPLPRRSELRFIFGHLSHGVARYLPQDCAYITVLREPGNRLLSYFRYVQRITDHPLHGPVSQRNMSFGDFLEYATENPVVRLESDNGQVRRLAGQSRQKSSLGQEATLFYTALHNIFGEDVVYGFTEHFDDFLERLKARKIIPDVKDTRLNTAPDKTDIGPELTRLTPAQTRIFERFTSWDKTFYDICKSAYFALPQQS